MQWTPPADLTCRTITTGKMLCTRTDAYVGDDVVGGFLISTKSECSVRGDVDGARCLEVKGDQFAAAGHCCNWA